MDKGLTVPNSADKLAENTPNVLKCFCPSPKVWDIIEKRLHRESVVSAFYEKKLSDKATRLILVD